MKRIFLYDVFDEKKKVKILEKVDKETVSEITKLRANAVTTYAHTGKPYKGRFSVTCVNREEFEKMLDGQDRVTMKRFDKAMKGLKENYTPKELRAMVFVCKEDKVS